MADLNSNNFQNPDDTQAQQLLADGLRVLARLIVRNILKQYSGSQYTGDFKEMPRQSADKDSDEDVFDIPGD